MAGKLIPRWLALTLVASIVAALDGGWIISWAALAPSRIWHGEVWRLVTWPLVETGVMSLLFTCAAIYKFGGELAERLGDQRLFRFVRHVVLSAAVVTCIIGVIPGLGYGPPARRLGDHRGARDRVGAPVPGSHALALRPRRVPGQGARPAHARDRGAVRDLPRRGRVGTGARRLWRGRALPRARGCGDDSRRRLDRRRRALRHRRRVSPAGAVSRQDVRDPRGARPPRAAPGICSAIRAFAPTPTCTRSAIRSGPGRTRRRSPMGLRSSRTCARRAEAYGIDRKIRLRSSGRARELVERGRALDRRRARRRTSAARSAHAGFLFMCAGYYDYDAGYTPDFAGASASAAGRASAAVARTSITTDKRVVVIGSGATAVTLVPELAKRAAHVTMLQRSPTLHRARCPTSDSIADWLRARLPSAHGVRDHALEERAARHGVLRRTAGDFRSARRSCSLGSGARSSRRGKVDVDPHFTPRYNPWDQRLCLVPDGDLFKAIRERARVGRDGPHRDVHRDRHSPALGRRRSTPTSSSRRRASS